MYNKFSPAMNTEIMRLLNKHLPDSQQVGQDEAVSKIKSDIYIISAAMSLFRCFFKRPTQN